MLGPKKNVAYLRTEKIFWPQWHCNANSNLECNLKRAAMWGIVVKRSHCGSEAEAARIPLHCLRTHVHLKLARTCCIVPSCAILGNFDLRAF